MLFKAFKFFDRKPGPDADTDFDYEVLSASISQALDDHTEHRPSLPDDNKIVPYRPLFEKERKHIVRAFLTCIYRKAKDLYDKNKFLGDNGYDIPRTYRLVVDPVDRRNEGGFLQNIEIQFGDAKEAFDKEEGTQTILDSPLASRRLEGILQADDAVVEQTGEDEFVMTLLWLTGSRFEKTARSLTVAGNNSGADIHILGCLCKGTNTICGRNGASDGRSNVIRLTTDEIPTPAIEVDVVSDREVKVKVVDAGFGAHLLDGRTNQEETLRCGQAYTFRRHDILNLGGICSIRLD